MRVTSVIMLLTTDFCLARPFFLEFFLALLLTWSDKSQRLYCEVPYGDVQWQEIERGL